MAKAKTRVFELAREIGVRSKDILEKCRAEGLDIKNHMSALSAGLEETIRDWFSDHGDGSAHTAVETAGHVDLEKARAKAKKSRKKKVKQKEEKDIEGDEVDAESVTTGEETTRQADEETSVTEEAEEKEKKSKKKTSGRAGPQVVPKPARLSGPKVVRVEEPDYVARPRSRPEPGVSAVIPKKQQPAVLGPEEEGEIEEQKDGKAKDKSKVRSRSPRRKNRVTETDARMKVKEWKERDLLERADRIAGAGTGYYRRRVSKGQDGITGAQKAGSGIKKGKVEISEPITVKKLSAATGIKVAEIIKKLMDLEVIATVNQVIDSEQARAVTLDYEIDLEVARDLSEAEILLSELENREKAEELPRATVVTFLGHVDHGKTSLLDYIRNSRVAEGEAGGITQAMGSYRYDMEDRHVTFLDTPGHEAFTAMRARGADMTDVVVLVVAVDDGVMPQTQEAINHARAAGVPIVVALNKTDLPNPDINRVMGQLAEHGLQPQEWGGNIEVVQTSAKTGKGIDDLVEVLNLEAEILELKAEVDAPASGYVIEATTNTAKGVLVTVLNMNGTLKPGDVVLAGTGYGFVRSIYNDQGKVIKEAGPAVPVSITGLNEIPGAGEKFYVVENIDRARTVARELKEKRRQDTLTASTSTPRSLEELFGKLDEKDKEAVSLLVKADSHGSLEALRGTLKKLGHEEVNVDIVHDGVGAVTESDVNLASVSDAFIIGFNVSADPEARRLAEDNGVKILEYSVIYEIVDSVKKLVIEGLAPEIKTEILGRAEVRQTFKVSRLGTIAGCYVTDGKIVRNARVKVVRDGVIVEEDRSLDSLKRVKDDAREVKSGLECGMKITGFDDIKTGDVIECYRTMEVARTE